MTTDQEIADLRDRLLTTARLVYYPKSREDAEDLVNDVILRMLVNKDKFVENVSLYGWAQTILRNTFINEYRKKTQRAVEAGTKINIYEDVFEYVSGFGEEADEPQREEDIRMAIDRLPEGERVCMNYLLCGYTYDQMSEILNIPLGTVKSRIFLARKRLQKELIR